MTFASNLSLQRLIQKLNEAFAAAPTAPTVIPSYATPAALPPAAAYMPTATASPAPGAPSGGTGLVFVASIARLAVSNGANWLRTDTGATIA